MIKLFILAIFLWLLPSCSFFSAPKTLTIGEKSDLIKLPSCIKFTQDKVTVFYERKHSDGTSYKGNVAFSFSPLNLLKVSSEDACKAYTVVTFKDVYNNTVADTGRFKVVISLKLIKGSDVFMGRGESKFHNSFGDFLNNNTQEARKEALESAIEMAMSKFNR